MISKSEFQDWKTQEVTRAFMAAAEIRVEDAKEMLAGSAGQDSNNDNFFRGFITAYRELQNFKVEDLTDDD